MTVSTNEENNGGDELLYELVEELTDRCRRAAPEELDAILDAHPKHAATLRRLLPTIRALNTLHRPVDDPREESEQDGGTLPFTLGDYRIIRELGRGGMGVVYEAEQLSLRRRVALKVLPFASLLDSRRLMRFKQEATAVAQMRHPNIVGVYATGCERGVHYITMEYVEGRTVATVIQQEGERRRSGSQGKLAASGDGSSSHPEGKLDVEPGGPASSSDGRRWQAMAVDIGIQVADALDHAHSLGIVHRDVKPSNLLLDAEGRALVTDFGLAQFEADTSLTMTGDLLGTLRYMSPEQARGGKDVDRRTDVYSLGVTLYELLALQPAYPAADRQELLREVLDGEPPSLRRMAPRIPRDLETIVLKAMAAEPGKRYGSAGELADDLRRLSSHQPIRARRGTPWGRMRKWTLRNRSLAMAATGTLLIAAVAAGMVARERQQRQGEQQVLATQAATIAEREAAARAERYVTDIHRAWQAWNRSSLSEMRSILQRWAPQGSETDLRGFEWHHLWRLSEASHDAIGRHNGAAYYLAFAPDGETLATAGEDGVRLWQSAWGKQLRHLGQHASDVNWLDFSPDGSRLASASDDKTVRIWDTNTWTTVRKMELTSRVLAAEFSPDGRFLAVAERKGSDGVGHNQLWLYTTDGWERTSLIPEADLQRLDGLCFSPDGARLAAAGGNMIWVCDTLKPAVEKQLSTLVPVHCVAFDATGRYVIAGMHEGQLSTFDCEGTSIHVTSGHRAVVEHLSLTANGQLLSASRDGTARFWWFDKPMEQVAGRIAHFPDPLWCVRASAKGGYVAAVDHAGRVFCRREPFIGGGGPVELPQRRYDVQLTFLKGGALFALPGPNLTVHQTDTLQPLGEVSSDVGELFHIAASADGNLLVAGPRGAELFDPETRKRLRRWSPRDLTGEDRALMPADLDAVPMLKSRSPEIASKIASRSPGFVKVVATPDAHLLAGIRPDGTVVVWDGQTLNELNSWIAHPSGGADIAICPDGLTLATAGALNGITLWNIATGRAVLEQEFHVERREFPTRLAFSPDGSALRATVARASHPRAWLWLTAKDADSAGR